jgi:Polysaccharide lyase
MHIPPAPTAVALFVAAGLTISPAAAPHAARATTQATKGCQIRGPKPTTCWRQPRAAARSRAIMRAAVSWQGETVSRGLTGWSQAESVRKSDLQSAVVQGRDASQVLVHPGDSPVSSGERTELVASSRSTGGVDGALRTYTWSTLFPSDFHPIDDSTWNIFAQWHESDSDGCHPNLAMQVNTKRQPAMLRLQVRGGSLDADCGPQESRSWDFAPVALNTWNDFQLKVGWSPVPGRGFVQLMLNGREVVPRFAISTLYPGQTAYLKQGFYRSASSQTSRLLTTAMMLTTDPHQ